VITAAKQFDGAIDRPNAAGSPAVSPLELWGGVECSIVRVGDNFRRQLGETGHLRRPSDLKLIAELGIRTVRYPVLWEMVSPDSPDETNWKWPDVRLGALRELSITPIAGLLHHGSGPRYTSLLDPEFPELLSNYAAKVAERFPWIDHFTPVNEPLTTARFSALYGHWYPHARDCGSFLRALVNQCAGVLHSMRAIRRVTPSAKLIQTEDLGKTFSTPNLAYQTEFDNQRRWLSLDLLCGRVDRTHPLYDLAIHSGIKTRELGLFLDDPCPPDIIGINHYVTSDRFLDDRLWLYRASCHGGNGRDSYADVEAVRVDLPSGSTGPRARLSEAWERYKRPLAVTEAHLGGNREDQVRWLRDVWCAARGLKQEGADIRAVTVWSLFGARDWNSLLTKRAGDYEPGAFDARAKPPRPTAIARAAAQLAKEGALQHPILGAAGWWCRNTRFYTPSVGGCGQQPAQTGPRLLITGASGTLGRAFAKICQSRGIDFVPLSRRDLDIADGTHVAKAIELHRPWAVINAAGFAPFPDGKYGRQQCFRVNTIGAECLARACARHDVDFISFSSALVFDGRLGRSYEEPDVTSPRCVYGTSKAQAETLIQNLHPGALIIRTSALFGPWDKNNFVLKILANISQGRSVQLNAQEVVSPTYLPDLVHAVLDILIDGERGIWHLANAGGGSWFELGRGIAQGAGASTTVIQAVQGERRNTALASARGKLMPSFHDALRRYLEHIEHCR
jgi:dTDP-4-dehydrorhamnose reductase